MWSETKSLLKAKHEINHVQRTKLHWVKQRQSLKYLAFVEKKSWNQGKFQILGEAGTIIVIVQNSKTHLYIWPFSTGWFQSIQIKK